MWLWMLSTALAMPQFFLQTTVVEVEDPVLLDGILHAEPPLLPTLAAVLTVDPRVNVISNAMVMAAYGETAEVEIGRGDALSFQLHATPTRHNDHSAIQLELMVDQDRPVTWSGTVAFKNDLPTTLRKGNTLVILTPLHVASEAALARHAFAHNERSLLVSRLFANQRRRARIRRNGPAGVGRQHDQNAASKGSTRAAVGIVQIDVHRGLGRPSPW